MRKKITLAVGTVVALIGIYGGAKEVGVFAAVAASGMSAGPAASNSGPLTATDLATRAGGSSIVSREQDQYFSETTVDFRLNGGMVNVSTFADRANQDQWVNRLVSYGGYHVIRGDRWAAVTEDLLIAYAVQDKLGGTLA